MHTHLTRAHDQVHTSHTVHYVLTLSTALLTCETQFYTHTHTLIFLTRAYVNTTHNIHDFIVCTLSCKVAYKLTHGFLHQSPQPKCDTGWYCIDFHAFASAWLRALQFCSFSLQMRTSFSSSCAFSCTWDHHYHCRYHYGDPFDACF